MNRKFFLKTGLIASLLPFANKFKAEPTLNKEKIGFIHVGALPEGTRDGDWAIIDNKTGNPFNKTEYLESTYQKGAYLAIQYADDIKGVIGGIIRHYYTVNLDLNYKNGYRYFQSFVGEDITIKYTGKNPKYIKYS
jgi:hypothetical protein